MEIEFDHQKNAINIAKHGFPLSLAGELLWDQAITWVDERYDYDELRMIALAPDTSILFHVSFVERNEVTRVISLRRATKKEALLYVHSH
jgi:uncharacterized protein